MGYSLGEPVLAFVVGELFFIIFSIPCNAFLLYQLRKSFFHVNLRILLVSDKFRQKYSSQAVQSGNFIAAGIFRLPILYDLLTRWQLYGESVFTVNIIKGLFTLEIALLGNQVNKNLIEVE